MDILQEIATLYRQLPEVACKGCGQCCVSPTCTLVEFIYLMKNAFESIPPEILETFILNEARLHPEHEGNLICALLAETKCLAHQWRTGACRLFGVASLGELGIANYVSCFNDITVVSGRADKAFIQKWLENVALLNETLHPFGKAPYFIYGFNLECWLDIYFDELLTVDVFTDMRNIMHRHINLSAFKSRYLLKTGLKEKVDKISLLTILLGSGDKDSLAEVLLSIRDDYPITGTYFVKEARMYLDELDKTKPAD